jgi:hypothetical protein
MADMAVREMKPGSDKPDAMGGFFTCRLPGRAQRLTKQEWSVMPIRVGIIRYEDVPADGVIDEGALVPVDGSTIISSPDGGCGMPRCTCFTGHFVQRLFPRDAAGTVFGYIVEFDSREELESTSAELLAQKAMH